LNHYFSVFILVVVTIDYFIHGPDLFKVFEFLISGIVRKCFKRSKLWLEMLSSKLKIRIYRTIILPVVLYGCETWSLTFKEERRLRVFENRVLRILFERKRDEVTGEWRKLHNEELNGLYSLPNIVRVIKSRCLRWAGHVAHMGTGEVCTGFWWGSLRGKRPLGREA
jgi:hypothetical protein